MFLGKMKKHGKIIWNWYLEERDLEYPSNRVMCSLQWYARHDKYPDYGYTGSWKSNLEYACDRMNGGRAKAILRLIQEERRGK
jgi:hypothetical protein